MEEPTLLGGRFRYNLSPGQSSGGTRSFRAAGSGLLGALLRARELEGNPIGQIKGVGINTFQYLRMMGGVDTAMPDKIVRSVVEEILRDASCEMRVEGDLALIETVNELGRITGYRSADICWMCWLLQ